MTTTPLGEAAPAVPAGAADLPAPRTLRLRDDRFVCLRPIRASDAEALRVFDSGLCEACHRFRYLGWMRPLSAEEALAMATVDFQRRFALVATVGRGGRDVIVADCRLIAAEDQPAEMAIAVADEYQGAGLGPALIRQLLSVAAAHGIAAVEARVKYDNERMMGVLRRLGFRRTAWELGVVTFTRDAA